MQSHIDPDHFGRTLEGFRTSLAYWQHWAFEYAGLKEEFEDLDHEPSPDEMVQIAIGYGGDVIDEEGMKSIIDYNRRPSHKSKARVINILNDRVEMGRKNTAALQKQIDKFERELYDLSEPEPSPNDKPQAQDLMEIIEELDDNDNIISSNLSTFEKAAAKVHEIAAKHKLNQALVLKPKDDVTDVPIAAGGRAEGGDKEETKEREAASTTRSGSHGLVTDVHPGTTDRIPKDQSKTAETHDKDMEATLFEHPTQSAGPSPQSSVAIDETSDLELQREMSQNLQEIRPIVATMDLEFDEDEEDDYEDYEADENEYGMSNIHDEISEDYIREMQALLDKHAAEAAAAIAEQPNDDNVPPKPTAVAAAAANPAPRASAMKRQPTSPTSSNSLPTRPKPTNSVRFAADLPPPHSTTASSRPQQSPNLQTVAPPTIAATIVERSAGPAAASSAAEAAPAAARMAARKASALAQGLGYGYDLQTEMQLYRQRMDKTAIDPRAFADRGAGAMPLQEVGDDGGRGGENGNENVPKMSRFKAARLGLIRD